MKRKPMDSKKVPDNTSRDSVKHILLKGVFWRILAIEGVLLIWSIFYMFITEEGSSGDLFWYAMRIVLLVGIIILFMMVSLKSFLTRKVITSLEAIALANRKLKGDDLSARNVDLPEDAPMEIQQIADSRKKMLDTILEVSEERLHLINFIKDTFGRYLSKNVVEEILASPEGRRIGGQKKTVTILMSDLRGFTSMSEDSDPEEIVRLLNRYLENMSKVIVSYGGIIDEFIGDSILAIFGGSEKHADDPHRAVACGVVMQNALDDLNETFVKEGYPPLAMGIGINTGTVVVGNIGSEVRTKYGIVGSAVNVAARIESNTTGGEVFLGEATYELVKSSVVSSEPHTVIMKGLKRPLVYYSVTTVGAPYSVSLRVTDKNERGTEISLPFKYWVIEDEKISGQGMSGETQKINENTIMAVLEQPLPRLTNIKLIFDFCTDTHCFEEIYAKVTSVGGDDGVDVCRFTITSIHPEDRAALEKWTATA